MHIIAAVTQGSLHMLTTIVHQNKQKKILGHLNVTGFSFVLFDVQYYGIQHVKRASCNHGKCPLCQNQWPRSLVNVALKERVFHILGERDAGGRNVWCATQWRPPDQTCLKFVFIPKGVMQSPKWLSCFKMDIPEVWLENWYANKYCDNLHVYTLSTCIWIADIEY